LAIWITLIRGLLAITLGTIILFWPEKSRVMLANFMGGYWLAAGIVSLRWGIAGQRARGLALLAGVIGVLAGLTMLGRLVAQQWLPLETLMAIVGVVIVLTGLIHIFGGFRQSDDIERTWSWSSFLLGLFEVVLGLLMVLASPGRSGTVVFWAASIWAFIGGALLIGDALRLRRNRLRQSEATTIKPALDGE
jgi:uncharacterized membrane protein HdeD (DUF308 family)